MRRTLMIVIGLLLVSSAGLAQPPRFTPNACPFFLTLPDEIEGETLVCGTLFVPENRAVPGSRLIELAVAILHSPSATPAPDPVIYLEGGPGGAALGWYDAFARSALRADRDIILIDQRGTGYSRPSLDCWEYWYEVDDPDRACRDRLAAADVDLAAYTSAQSAQDIADLIVALELEAANLWGVSYGTRLALTILRDRPERIRSVILDAVYPPQAQGWEENAINGYLAFEVLFAGCAADAACNAAYPDLEQVFLQAVTQLNATPLPLTDENEEDSGELTGDQLVDDLFLALYDTAAIPFLPARIYAAAAGDSYGYYHIGLDDAAFDPAVGDGLDLSMLSEAEYLRAWTHYLGYATPEETQAYLDTLTEDEYDAEQESFETYANGSNGVLIDTDAEGLYNSVECTEEIPFNMLEQAYALTDELDPPVRAALVAGYETQIATCAIWDVPVADRFEAEAVTSAVPALVLSGEYDPITPPSWGQMAADALPNSIHLIFPGMGHSVVDIAECPTQIARAFLANPALPPDASCIAAMTAPAFYVAAR